MNILPSWETPSRDQYIGDCDMAMPTKEDSQGPVSFQ
jgi:hypothetical protein